MIDLKPYLVGHCAAFAAFAERLAQVAASDATLLIAGESGSGKNAAAAAAHALSRRARGPLVSVSLSALAPSLIEAELFGHEEGAFTGATHARSGRMRQAQGGTLVLDDVANLPLTAQAKLLRVLQERAVEPVGGSVPVPIDVRLIATASVDLEAETRAGRFRSDLYWRLAVVQLEMPPLRARRDDLPELCEHFVESLAARLGLALRRLTPAALERLCAHAWPGNLRELENALERVLVLAPRAGAGEAAPAIEAAEFDFLEPGAGGVADELAERALAHGLLLADFEVAFLRAAVREQRGNLSAAARQVGLSRKALEYRLGQARAADGEPRG